jgi:hypothetical protein
MIRPSLSKNPSILFLKDKRSLESTIDSITDILSCAYICSQFGFRNRLIGDKEIIYKTTGKKLAQALNLPYTKHYNHRNYIWARENQVQYNWYFYGWYYALLQYNETYGKNHPALKLYHYFHNLIGK